MTPEGAFHTEILTSDDQTRYTKEAETNSNGDVAGLTVTWGSDEPCANGGTNSFTAKIMCEPMQTATTNDIIQSVDTTDSCNPTVTINSAVGCPVDTGSELDRWLDSNPLVLAVFMLIVGPVIAFLGKKWFPYVAAIVAGISVMDLCAWGAAEMGWLSSSWMPYVVLAVAIILAIIVGSLIRRAIWFAVGLVGIVAGASFGVVLWGTLVVSGLFAGDHPWTLILFGVLFAIIAGVLSFKWGQQMIVLATSMIGSYIFMRGWTLIFEGYP